MIIRGSVKAVIGDQERLFVFNNNVFIEYAERYGDGNLVSFNNHYRNNNLKAMRNIMFLALLEGADYQDNKLPDDFSEKHVGRWEMEMEALKKVIETLGDSFNFGVSSMQMQDQAEEETKKK